MAPTSVNWQKGRLLVAGSAGGVLLLAVVCVSSRGAGEVELSDGRDSDRLRQIGGLISEVAAVKHALLDIESKQERSQLAARQPSLAPSHIDSFDYPASVGGAGQIQHGEWSERSADDDRLEMIPRRAKLEQIDKLVSQDECNWPECVTRSGLAPGSDLYPEPQHRVAVEKAKGNQPRHDESMRDAKRQMRSVYHTLSDWIAGDTEGSRTRWKPRQEGGGEIARARARTGSWPNSDAPFLQSMEPKDVREREVAAIERGVGLSAQRPLEDQHAQMRKSDRAYLLDMSAESKREADAEERGEQSAKDQKARADELQSRVGVGTDWREPRRRQEREERREREVLKKDTYAEQMQGLKQTYAENIAEEKKRFAQERLLLKQQGEMDEMKAEIARLKDKTKVLKAAQMHAEREGDDTVARLTTEGAESPEEFRREVEEEAGEVAGRVAAREVKKELANEVRGGSRQAARREDGARDQDGVTRQEVPGGGGEAHHASDGGRDTGGKAGQQRGGGGFRRERARQAALVQSRRGQEQASEAKGGAFVAQAVPVKSAIAVARAAPGESGGGGGGHPALRATATPLVLARALKDKERGLEMSKEALHEKERRAAAGKEEAGQRDDHGAAVRPEARGSRRASQEALRKEWDNLQAKLGEKEAHARSRKVDSEGAERMPGGGARSRSSSRRQNEPLPLPRALSPHALSKPEIDERDDVVGTRWHEDEEASVHRGATAAVRSDPRGARRDGEGAVTAGKSNPPGHTNGGPSAKFALTIGSHGTRAVDSLDIPKSKLDLAGTSPYWASDIPAGMPQREAELKGDNKLNDVPPELRKSFRQRMEDLVSGKAEERQHDSGPLRQLANGIKTITGKSDAKQPRSASGTAWASDGTVPPWKAKGFDAQQVLRAAAEKADDDPLNANDRINKYMDSRVTSKESAFKKFENTLHYDPNAF